MSNGPSDETSSLIGLVIAGAVEIESTIGAGSTGRVYRGRQLALGRFVAVKVLHPFLMQAAGVKERFHREARLLSRLHHPGLVRVLASGELPRRNGDQGGEAFLIYEYHEGETLRERLRTPGKMSLTEAISTMLAIADAVAEAHDHNIIHRDLKPENVMSVASNKDETRFVVLDFGLARALDAEGAPLTREGALLGTPQYMSPEAARGEPATCASDVYALATMLYELLAGAPPFSGGSAIAILAEKASASAVVPDPALLLPVAIERFLMKNLEKAMALRCPTAQAFLVELIQAARASNLDLGNLVPRGTSDRLTEFIHPPLSP